MRVWTGSLSFLLLLTAHCLCFAQKISSNEPLLSKQQEQYVSYWTDEPNWHSELQLRNNMPADSLVVTPVAVSADGREYPLETVRIKPQSTLSLDLPALVRADASALVGSYGSLVLRYESPFRRALYAAVMVHRMARPIAFHIDGMDKVDSEGRVGREGIWWLPKPGTQDYLILSNESTDPLPLRLSISAENGDQDTREIVLASRETKRLSVGSIVRKSGFKGTYGGISIAPESNGRSLDSLHVAFNEQDAFSATLKMFDYDPTVTPGERDYNGSGLWTLRAPMLALSTPDPELALPANTQLHPKVFIRNVTKQPQKVAVDFYWRTDEQTKGYTKGPQLTLAPFETKAVVVDDLPLGMSPPRTAHWSSVYLRTTARPEEIVAVAASYDDTLKYGAQTPFMDQLSYLWKGGKFEFDGSHNSLITVGNDSETPTKTLFTLFYNQGAETSQYELEQTISPHDQMWVNVGLLIRNSVPDRNGKVLPSNLTFGSYEFRDESHGANGRLFEGKVIYDVSMGHVSYGCAACCGYTQWRMLYNPFSLGVTTQYGDGVQILDDCNSPWYTDNSDFNNWSTLSTGIAQTTSQGMHTGMSVGGTTSKTSGQVQGRPNRYTCPVTTMNPSGPTNVQPIFNVRYSAYIPVDHVTAGDGCSYQGNNASYTYIGDAGRGTARATAYITQIPDKQQSSGYGAYDGQTRQYGYGSPANGSTLSSADEDNVAGDCYHFNAAQTGTPSASHDETYSSGQGQEHMTGNASNPFEPAGAIHWDFRVVFNTSNPSSPTAYVNYNFTCYPSHQVFVNGQSIELYTPPYDNSAYVAACLTQAPGFGATTGQTNPVAVPTH